MTLAAKIRDNKAVYTGAGAVDLAVEKLRELPDQVAKVRGTVTENYEKYRGTVTTDVTKVRGTVTGNVDKVRGTVTARVTEVRENVAKYQEKADSGAIQAYVATVTTKVNEVIDDLATRGKTVINKAADEVIVEARDAKSVEAPKPAPKPAAAPKPKAATTAKKPVAKKADS
jgi:hypothetical protein